MSKHLTSSRSIFIFVCALVTVIGGLITAAIYNSRFTVIEPMAKVELRQERLPDAPPEAQAVPTVAAAERRNIRVGGATNGRHEQGTELGSWRARGSRS